MLRNVVFPEPDGPISETKSPRAISSVSSSRAAVSMRPAR